MRIGCYVASSLLCASLSQAAWARPPHPPSYSPDPDSGKSFSYLTPGISASKLSDKALSSSALGAELAYTYFSNADAVSFGGFGQAELLVTGATRFASGLRLDNVLGCELGYAYRGAHAGQASSSAVQIGLSLDLGRHLTLGGRMALPVTSAARRSVGTEAAFTLTLKAPVLVHVLNRRWPMFHWMGGG